MGWIFLVLLLYALVVLAEQALFVLSPTDLNHKYTDESARSRRLTSLHNHIRPALAAMLFARFLFKIILSVGICSWMIQAEMIRNLFYQWSEETGKPGFFFWITAGVVLAVALSALFWLVRKFALRTVPVDRHAERLLSLLSPFILFWKTLFAPFIQPDRKPDDQPASFPSEPVAENPAVVGEKREMELLKSIVHFGDTTVKQVMQPRSKVVAVDFRINFHDLLAIVRQAEFSRLPVYDEDLDNVTGILYVKDLVPHLDKKAGFEWQQVIRTNVLLAPESKRCSELLQEFKKEKIHLAVVVDEYGGSSGIVTMEDLLEEVTGDIRDEFDEESEVRYRKLDDHTYLFEGQTLLNDVCRIAGLPPGTFDEARNNADTLAGLVLELKGEIPQAGAEIEWEGFLLSVIAANNRRIEQLKLTLPRS